MTSQVNKAGLPTWAKVLIVLVIVGIVGSITLGIGMFFMFKHMFVQEPKELKQLAAQTVTLQDPLPAGYNLNMGLDMFGPKVLTFSHDGDQQMIVLISFPKAESNPKAMIKDITEHGVDTGSGRTVAEEIKQQGQAVVGGEEMSYVVGTMTDKSGRHQGMLGVLVPKNKEKTILIYAVQPNKEPYSFEVTQNFLKAVKSFN
jgi:hypothetical protein